MREGFEKLLELLSLTNLPVNIGEEQKKVLLLLKGTILWDQFPNGLVVLASSRKAKSSGSLNWLILIDIIKINLQLNNV